mmetsp:Transcript_107520/g.342881  ORF Transcript_107520/g.342881 Transcript_107520/m.342881 type:complete len:370 (-) Transcript_107520:112-1221(-)
MFTLGRRIHLGGNAQTTKAFRRSNYKFMRAVRNQITARLRSDGSRLPGHRTTTDLSLRAFVGNFGLSFDIDAVPCDLTPLPSRTQISNVSKNDATEDHQQDNANRRPHHDPAHTDDTHGTCTRRRTGHEACDGLDAVAKEPPDARHTLGGHRERAGQLAKATPNDEESQHAQRNRFRVLRSLHVSEQVLLAYTPYTHLQKIEAGAQPRIICNPLTNGASIIPSQGGHCRAVPVVAPEGNPDTSDSITPSVVPAAVEVVSGGHGASLDYNVQWHLAHQIGRQFEYPRLDARSMPRSGLRQTTGPRWVVPAATSPEEAGGPHLAETVRADVVTPPLGSVLVPVLGVRVLFTVAVVHRMCRAALDLHALKHL